MKTIELTTPSLGARAEMQGDTIVLRVGNEGGRGVPSDLLLLPLESDDLQDLRCALDWETVRLGNGKPGPWNVYCSSLGKSPRPGPIIKTIAPATWAQAQAHGGPLLVVLSFGDPSSTGTGAKDRLAPEARKQIEEILEAADKAAWRRRGLLVPGARRVPEPSPPSPPYADKLDRSPHKPMPAAEPATLVFALASCQYPAGIVDGTPQDFEALGGASEMPRGPADASLLRLHDRLVAPGPTMQPNLLLLAGDQVYIDATAGLFDARAVARPGASRSAGLEEEGFRVPYQNWLGSVGAQSVFGRLSVRMMLDDHEIGDNWEPVGDGPSSKANKRLDTLKSSGVAAFGRYQSAGQVTTRKLWDARFEHEGLRCFMADTRTQRQPRKAANFEAARIMSCRQSKALRGWMGRELHRPAFILSSSILLPRRCTSARSRAGALQSDAWDGYPGSLERLLVHIGRTGRKRLVFLSGDEHLSCVVRATVTMQDWDGRLRDPITLHSIHSSALYAPYPFANGQSGEFAVSECWNFHDPDEPLVTCCCKVEVLQWVPGDGYACLRLTHEHDGGWSLDVRFDRAEGEIEIPPLTL